MGLLGGLIGGKPGEPRDEPPVDVPAAGKYTELCSACGKGGTEKKWAGKYWHKRCLRAMKRAAKSML